MPRRRALTSDQLDALMALPTTEAEIIQHYTLSKDDISIICRRRRLWNRLGFAIQLCGLRYPGRLLRPGELGPEAIVRYVAQQLDVLPKDLADYAARSQTRYDQLDALRREFGYSSITQPDRRSLQDWLLPVALATIRPEVVAEALMSELRRRQIAAPGPSVIENIVATAMAHADRRVMGLLTDDLTDAQRKALDDLISLRADGRESHLSWARQLSRALNQRSFARLLDQLEYLRAIGVPDSAAAGVAYALEKLVRQQQAHPLAALFGDGSSSSSDGQHFPLGGRAEVTGSVNPHKGSEPAISIYTHLSSRFAPYSAKTVSATEGEAPYVLDGLINAGAPIGITTHHTDGGGVSDHVFGLCPMLGFRFAPRIPNLNDRRLYTFDPAASSGALAPFVGGRIDEGLIAVYWDEVLRLGTSIRTGHVSASLMLKRLGSYPRQNGLTLALRELGRIERTLFTLDWLEDPALRRKTTIELNKGESRNALARAVCFHRLGRFRDRTHEGRQYRTDSLNLVVAAIVLWNTVYLGRAVDAVRAGGEHIEMELLAHIAPLGWQHINLTGDYLWGEIRNDPQNWKPLRQKINLLAAA